MTSLLIADLSKISTALLIKFGINSNNKKKHFLHFTHEINFHPFYKYKYYKYNIFLHFMKLFGKYDLS